MLGFCDIVWFQDGKKFASELTVTGDGLKKDQVKIQYDKVSGCLEMDRQEPLSRKLGNIIYVIRNYLCNKH